jgi:hypothetical protein
MTDDGGTETTHDGQLQELIPTAQSVAKTSFMSLRKDHRFADEMAVFANHLESWDFFMTAACVEAAVLGVRVELAFDKTLEAVGPMIGKKVYEWNPDGLRFLDDCDKFLANSLKGVLLKRESAVFQERFVEATGMWVLWNLYGRAPTFEECQLARAIGFCAIPFLNWWE